MNLLESERALQSAMLRGDVAALDDLLHDDVVYIGPDGVEVRKAADLAAHESRTLAFDQLEELGLEHTENGDAATTVARTHLVGRYAGEPFDFEMTYTRTWVYDGARWRVIRAIGSV